MMVKVWKERINATRIKSAEGRGEVLPKTPKEIKDRLDAVSDRGGIVFVSQEAKMELLGDKDVSIV